MHRDEILRGLLSLDYGDCLNASAVGDFTALNTRGLCERASRKGKSKDLSNCRQGAGCAHHIAGSNINVEIALKLEPLFIINLAEPPSIAERPSVVYGERGISAMA